MKFCRYLLTVCFLFHTLSSSVQPVYSSSDDPENDNSIFYVQLAGVAMGGVYVLLKMFKFYGQNLIVNGTDEYGQIKGTCLRNFCCYGCCWCLPKNFINYFVVDLPDDKVKSTMDDIKAQLQIIIDRQKDEEELFPPIASLTAAAPAVEQDE